MATEEAPAATPLAVPTIHEGNRTADGSGVIEYGKEIDEATAVAERAAGRDIVVRGDQTTANRNLARRIEAQVGTPSKAPFPHKGSAGSRALPHFHQQSRDPGGHAFYETDKLKARRKK